MTDAPIILPMTRADLAGVRHVLETSGLFPPDMLDAMAVPGLSGEAADIWLVARSGTAVLGFAYIAPERMTLGTWNMLAIAVDRDLQGQGVGGLLVHEAERRLADDGHRLLLVETSGDDEYTLTRRFYTGLGYTQVASIPAFYQAGEDKIVFAKALRDAG